MENEKDPLADFTEKAKAKLALGKMLFTGVVVPKAKETLEKTKAAAETLKNEFKDRLDPMSGLARHAQDVKEHLKTKGFSAKDADSIVKKTVESSLKKPKKERK